VLYHAQIAPARAASDLGSADLRKLRESIQSVLAHAVEVDADDARFPQDWLFHHRWGGKRGSDRIGGKTIVRETVGGRTTAWVPEVQN
jgi:formamidopyrimidine-DNA glycosylase